MSDSAMPSLDLVRQVTDQHLLSQLINETDVTRAELAARTGISKPTVSESIRRLLAAGLVAESGKQSGKRGPSGTFYRLRDDAGYALTVSIGPGGVLVETTDLRGDRLGRATADVPGPVRGAELVPTLERLVTQSRRGLSGTAISAAVNVAGPVDQRTQRLARLPYSPYFLDDFDPAATFRDQVDGPVEVDNDVNWAAAAEHAEGRAVGLDDFCYVYLGPGIGAALYAGGSLVRGHRGLAGELGNVWTEGADGRSRRLADCFAAWREPRTDAIDLTTIDAALADPRDSAREDIARAVATALASFAAVFDPNLILLSGPWATTGGLDARIAELLVSDASTAATVHSATLGADAAHRGARARAVADARTELLRRVA